MLVVLCFLWRFQGRIFPCLFQASGDPRIFAISWLTVVSLHSLPPSSQGLLLSVPSLSYRMSVTVFRTHLVQYHPTLTWLPLQRLWVYSGAQFCQILCNTMDFSPSGSFIHGIFQARMLEYCYFLLRGSSQPRDPTHISCIDRQIPPTSPPGKPHKDSVFK